MISMLNLRYNDYRYGMKLSRDFELRMSIFKVHGEARVRVRLFTYTVDDYTNTGDWVAVNKESSCKIRKTPRGEYIFRHELPKEYKYLHGTLFYIDDFCRPKNN